MPLLKFVSDIAERTEILLSAIRAVKYKNQFFVFFCSKRPKLSFSPSGPTAAFFHPHPRKDSLLLKVFSSTAFLKILQKIFIFVNSPFPKDLRRVSVHSGMRFRQTNFWSCRATYAVHILLVRSAFDSLFPASFGPVRYVLFLCF